MANKDRYCVSYCVKDPSGYGRDWQEVTAKTRQEGEELYHMLDGDKSIVSRSLIDTVNDKVILQEGELTKN